MKIIPVVDVLDGVVVHAVRGRRRDYKPLKSSICSVIDPLGVTIVFRNFGFDEIYLADLDAIMKNRANYDLYSNVAKKAGLKLMVDAGVTDLRRAEEVQKTGVSKVVIGTETLEKMDFVSEAIERLGREHVIVSLDLWDNRVLSKFPMGDLAEPLVLLRELAKIGVEQVIILDLSKVGSGEGVDFQLLRMASANSKLRLFSGGGVRDIKDLRVLRTIGVSGVLLATALHSGKISLEDLRRLGFLH